MRGSRIIFIVCVLLSLRSANALYAFFCQTINTKDTILASCVSGDVFDCVVIDSQEYVWDLERPSGAEHRSSLWSDVDFSVLFARRMPKASSKVRVCGYHSASFFEKYGFKFVDAHPHLSHLVLDGSMCDAKLVCDFVMHVCTTGDRSLRYITIPADGYLDKAFLGRVEAHEERDDLPFVFSLPADFSVRSRRSSGASSGSSMSFGSVSDSAATCSLKQSISKEVSRRKRLCVEGGSAFITFGVVDEPDGKFLRRIRDVRVTFVFPEEYRQAIQKLRDRPSSDVDVFGQLLLIAAKTPSGCLPCVVNDLVCAPSGSFSALPVDRVEVECCLEGDSFAQISGALSTFSPKTQECIQSFLGRAIPAALIHAGCFWSEPPRGAFEVITDLDVCEDQLRSATDLEK